nr:hypothetical protein B0A51_04928 [Rachicladosporium sp. CCFEE 5018]
MAQQQMIRPNQIDTLPYLDDDTRKHFKSGLTGLWQQYEGSPEGSPAKNEARSRIQQASSKLMQRMSSGNRPGSSSNGQQPRPPQMNGQMPQQGQMAPQGTGAHMAQQMQQQQAQQQAPAQSQQNSQAELVQLQTRVKAQVTALNVFPEPTISSKEEFDAYKLKFQNMYGQHLLKRARAEVEIRAVQALMKDARDNGRESLEEWKTRGMAAQQAQQAAAAAAQALERKNNENKVAYTNKQNRAQGGQAQAQIGGQAQRPVTQNGGQGDVKMEQRMSASPPQPQNQFTQQQPGQMPQQQVPQHLPQQQTPQQTMHQQTPQTGTQPQMPQQNYPQQNMAHQGIQQQQQRQQINTQQAAQYGNQQYQTPQSAVPQSAMSAQPSGPPRPLTQSDALNRANSYSQAQQQSTSNPQPPQASQPMQTPHGTMSASTLQFPQSATQHTPTSSGFPQTTNQQFNSANTKFPIPKTLSLSPNTQQPVAGPASRPTMLNQSGLLHAPGIQKPPPFTLEGEGDHVLSKRKLDELVRQITHSSDPADGLSPDVQESVLSMCDNFVDNLIQSSCRLAKLRQGQTLELRDVQMVLERNYGIRIPGYSLDEVRSVRKFQPASGWVGKVQAVQAAKVMGGGKGD